MLLIQIFMEDSGPPDGAESAESAENVESDDDSALEKVVDIHFVTCWWYCLIMFSWWNILYSADVCYLFELMCLMVK